MAATMQSRRNHVVCQTAGSMMKRVTASGLFHWPSLLEARTRKVYLPGSRLV